MESGDISSKGFFVGVFVDWSDLVNVMCFIVIIGDVDNDFIQMIVYGMLLGNVGCCIGCYGCVQKGRCCYKVGNSFVISYNFFLFSGFSDLVVVGLF